MEVTFGGCQEKVYLCGIKLKITLKRHAETYRQRRGGFGADVAVG